MKDRTFIIQLTLSLIFAVSVLSCGLGGGGGGGEDELIPANAFIEAAPREIDSGERIRFNVLLSDIKEDGVLLKVRFNSRLIYVKGTSQLRVNDDDVRVNPAANETVNNNQTYLVYDLPGGAFGNERNAQLEFILEGAGKLTRSNVEVDADFNDPNIPFKDKFTTLSPEFDNESSVEVTVDDSSGQNQATITPTPTITLTPSLTPTQTSTRTPRATLTPTATPR